MRVDQSVSDHSVSDHSEGERVRTAGRADLATALAASRRDTLAAFAAIECALGAGDLSVPQLPTLNPPLWELGHIGWFQEYWIGRNPQRDRGERADPDARRPDGVRAGADALYDSSRVPHVTRWRLPLPDAAATRADLDKQLDRTLVLLAATADETDDALYFFRLALLHEDMHLEAARYMAHALGIELGRGDGGAAPHGQPVLDDGRHDAVRDELPIGPGVFTLGRAEGGFAFDNERQAHPLRLPGYRIDRRVVRWAEFIDFVDAGGYREPRWWSAAGRQWLAAEQPSAPRYLRRMGDAWQVRDVRLGGLPERAVQPRSSADWRALDPTQPACHINYFEAQAWCAWAGRRLPTEAEWERAAVEFPATFAWGWVWEWTASRFAPYQGFVAHPYRDYSAPWFDGRPVLRGASFATQPRMRHPRYRNFFTPERSDIFAGFRSCAINDEVVASDLGR